ncbi:hypothetical protein R6Q57_006027 [Mikania cordata]
METTSTPFLNLEEYSFVYSFFQELETDHGEASVSKRRMLDEFDVDMGNFIILNGLRCVALKQNAGQDGFNKDVKDSKKEG